MFAKMLKSWRASRDLEKAIQHPLITMAFAAGNAFWYDDKFTRTNFPEEYRKEKLAEFVRLGAEVADSENQLIKNRELLYLAMYGTSFWELLYLSNPETPDTAHRTTIPGVTADFWEKLPEAADRFPTFRMIVQSMSDPPRTLQALHTICHLQYRVQYAEMMVLSSLRKRLNDVHANPDLDWLEPCYRVVLAMQDFLIRVQLGMPPALPREQLKSIMGIGELIKSGTPCPDQEWTHLYGLTIPAPA